MGAQGGSDGAIAYDSGEFETRNVTMRLPRDVVRKMRDTVFGFECGPSPSFAPASPEHARACQRLCGTALKSRLDRACALSLARRFFVTGVEDYQANGVLFKGNLRGDPARAHRHISERLQARPG